MLLYLLQNSTSVASNKITSRVRPKGEGGRRGRRGRGSGRVRVRMQCPMLMWCLCGVCLLLWQVCGVAFSEDGSYFVTAGNRSVKFWYFDTSGRDGRVNTCTLASFPSCFHKSLGMLYEHHTEL